MMNCPYCRKPLFFPNFGCPYCKRLATAEGFEPEQEAAEEEPEQAVPTEHDQSGKVAP